MQMHITIDGSTTPEQLTALSAAILKLTGRELAPAGAQAAPTPAPAPVEEAEDETPKAKPAPKAKAKPKAKPEAEEVEVEEVEEEAPKAKAKPADKVDYAALRAETRELFAGYAEEVGTVKGLALLQEFNVSKFKDLPDGELSSMRKRLLELGE